MDALNREESNYYKELAASMTPKTSSAELKGKFQPGWFCKSCGVNLSQFQTKCGCQAKKRGGNNGTGRR